MKAFINNDEFIIIFEEESIIDLTLINNTLKEIPSNVKRILFDLNNVKYVNSVFIDYLIQFNSIIKAKNILLKLINCPENINALITKIQKDHQIEIELKDI